MLFAGTFLLVLSLLEFAHCQTYVVDFNVAQNEAFHNSYQFKIANEVNATDDARMIVRRGYPFIIDVQSTREVEFKLVPFNVITTREELISIFVSNETFKGWEMSVSPTDQGFSYKIIVPPTAEIGIYHWRIVDNGVETKLSNELVVLFNPWCEEDEVYLQDETAIKEYVLNEQGLLWAGSADSFGSMGWLYEQFHYEVLEVTLYFISQLQFSNRSSAIIVSRHLSSWMNVNDNNGLLWGRWSEPYTDGQKPSYWTGSLEIYKLYRAKQSGVKYGQCWVFGGVLTTGGRALGIPARTLTNFDSAHESQSSRIVPRYAMKLDTFFDKDGAYESTEGGSIWNFHVWSEFWMRRDPTSYSGWQAVDATPQERSNNLYQMGPASVAAIKAVDRLEDYDTDFVTSEVGCSVYQWIGYDTGNEKHPTVPGYWLLSISKNSIGHQMSTKSIGRMSRSDITSNYKSSSLAPHYHSKHLFVHSKQLNNTNVTFEIVTPDVVNVGEDFALTIHAKCPYCNSTSSKMLMITGSISIIKYTGEVVAVLKQGTINVSLVQPYTEQSIIITRKDYTPYLNDNHLIQYNAFVKYYDRGNFTGEYANKFGRFQLNFPPLVLEASNRNASTFTLTVTWVNPLSIKLTNCILRISGISIADQDVKIGTINETSSFKEAGLLVFQIDDPTRPVTVFAKLVSDQITPINGQLQINPTSKKRFDDFQ